MKLVELVSKTQISQPVLSRILGKKKARAYITEDELKRVADATGVTPEWILGQTTEGIQAYIDTIISHYEHFDEFKSRAVIDLIGRVDLHKYYVPLNARDVNGAWHGAIADFVHAWLQDPKRNHLSILGDFGSGKSSFCLNLVYELAKRYRTDSNNRIPIFVSLVSLKGFVDLSDMRARIMRAIERYKLGIQSFDELQRLLETGHYLLILDGFDEMTAGTDRPRTRKNLEALNQFALGRNKVILTCRTHYFTTQRELTTALNSAHDTELMAIVRAQPSSTIVILEDLSDEQIIEYLQKRTTDWARILEKIRCTYDLRDLAKRPLLLWMIAQTVPALIDKESVSAADLYDAYTRLWIDHEDERSAMSTDVKAEFMRELAFAMFRQDEKQAIHYRELSRPIREYFGDRIAPGTDDLFEHDVRTCSFLNRDEAGYYRFINKSFMEFFVALKLSEELARNNFSNFDKQRLSAETAGFLGALLRKQHGVTNDDLICRIDDTKRKTFDEVGYRATNAVQILRQANDKSQFAGRELSERVFRGADFQNLDLTGTTFRGSDLSRASFNHSVLINADFRDTDLEDVALGENNAIVGLDVSPNDCDLAVGTSDGEIKIYSTTARRYVSTLSGHTNSVKAVAYSGDGEFLVSGGIDGSVRVWSLLTLEELIRLRGHHRGVRSVVWCPKGSRVASGSYDLTVRVWTIDIPKRSWRQEYCLEGHRGPVYGVAFDPMGKQLASSSADGSVRIWDTVTGCELNCLSHLGQADTVGYSHDGALLAAGDGKDSVRIWNVGSLREKASYSLHAALIFSVCFSPDDSYVASGDQDGRIVVWDVKAHELWWEISSAHRGVVNGLRFLNEGRWLASAAEDGTLKIWDIQRRNPAPVMSEGVADDLHVQGMKIRGATGLSEARIAFLKSKGAIV